MVIYKNWIVQLIQPLSFILLQTDKSKTRLLKAWILSLNFVVDSAKKRRGHEASLAPLVAELKIGIWFYQSAKHFWLLCAVSNLARMVFGFKTLKKTKKFMKRKLFSQYLPSCIFFVLCYVVCVDPPTAPAYSQTTPTDISGQFLAVDTIEYSCDGDLSPDESTTITCEDMGPPMAVWCRTLISDCSKLIITR